MIVHCKHEGCYDFKYYEDEESKLKLTCLRINPPKIFMFNDKETAQDFFVEYIHDVDEFDPRCKKGNEISHVEYCSCGITDLDDDGNPTLFYNKRDQIFLLENGAQVFNVPQNTKNDISNMNLLNQLIKKCKKLNKEEHSKYIELANVCKECLLDTEPADPPKKNETTSKIQTNINIASFDFDSDSSDSESVSLDNKQPVPQQPQLQPIKTITINIPNTNSAPQLNNNNNNNNITTTSTIPDLTKSTKEKKPRKTKETKIKETKEKPSKTK